MTEAISHDHMNDEQLLAAYADQRSEDALGQLVRRHVDLVYSAARRQVSDPQMAEDITQAVFIVLSRKARVVADRGQLAGWLVKTTHFAVRDAMKKESRRRRHEREAAIMRSSSEASVPVESGELCEELDAAMARLSDADRAVLALRYLQGMTAIETARSLAISAEAANKRISRAIGRLRKIMTGHGAAASPVVLQQVLEHLPHVAAPGHLAAGVTNAVAAGASNGAAAGIAQGVNHMMMAAKIKVASAVAAAVLFAAGAGIGGIKLLADQTEINPPAASTGAPNPLPAPGQTLPNPVSSSGQLANGVSLEIVGICESPSRGKKWWDVAGNVLPQAVYDGMRMNTMEAGPGYVTREVAVGINLKVAGTSEPATMRWGLEDSAGSFSGEVRGRLEANVEATGFRVRDNPKGMTLNASIAAGKWTTLVTDTSAGSMATGIGGMEFVFSEPFRVNNETHIVVGVIGINAEDMRLKVTDRSGQMHIAMGRTSAGSLNGFVGEFAVALPLNSIRSCELQTRPFNQWIKITGIAIKPGQNTDVQITTSDDKGK